jgi:hypothetical protein
MEACASRGKLRRDDALIARRPAGTKKLGFAHRVLNIDTSLTEDVMSTMARAAVTAACLAVFPAWVLIVSHPLSAQQLLAEEPSAQQPSAQQPSAQEPMAQQAIAHQLGANVLPAPPGHRQPKAADVPPDERPGAAGPEHGPPPTAAQSADDERARKILESVCPKC